MSSLQERLRELAHRHSIVALYAFGSRAVEVASRVRGQEALPQHPQSDVDIAVQPAPGHRLTAKARVRLTMALEDLLDVRRVDLVVLPEADPFLAVEIIRGELLVCRDPDAQAEDELYVLRRAGDLAPYAQARWQQTLIGAAP